MDTIEVGIRSSERDRQRATRMLFVAVACGSTSLYAAFTAAVVVATEIGSSRAWSGFPGATSILGAGVGSALLARLMARSGRRLGLQVGWAVGAGGAALAIVAVAAASFPGLVVAMALVGIGHTANQLTRFAVADMHGESQRPAILGWIVWAGTIGAALGPSLLQPGNAVAVALGMDGLAGGFLVAIVFYVVALGFALAIPDPTRVTAPDTTPVAGNERTMTLRTMSSLPHVRLALGVMVVGQVAMILIMTMTPLHIREHGHTIGVVGLVMSAHFVGMFAFAPWIGKLIGRIGSLTGAKVGFTILVLASAGAAASPTTTGVLIGICLFLLGIGWCFGFVSGSALLVRGLSYSQRVQLQGSVDGIVWTFSALASLGSGFLLAAFGFGVLSVVTAVSVATPLGYLALRRPAAASTV